MSRNRTARASRPGFARAIRILSVPMILLWVAAMITLNVAVPQLEVVTRQNSVALSPQDAPAVIAANTWAESSRSTTLTAPSWSSWNHRRHWAMMPSGITPP